jgi:DNA-binding NarL/FixJ family response regulator
MTAPRPLLLAIIELGGYPNFAPLYERLGFEVVALASQRKARSFLKERLPAVIVAEYNFQSDFRDRSSNLETLMAVLQRHPEVKVVVFYQQEYAAKFEGLRSRFAVHAALTYPIDAARLEEALRAAVGTPA